MEQDVKELQKKKPYWALQLCSLTYEISVASSKATSPVSAI
jgi:hypothetical protein